MGEAMDMDEFVRSLLPQDVMHVSAELVDVAYVTSDDEKALVSLYQGDEVTKIRFLIESGQLVTKIEKETWL